MKRNIGSTEPAAMWLSESDLMAVCPVIVESFPPYTTNANLVVVLEETSGDHLGL